MKAKVQPNIILITFLIIKCKSNVVSEQNVTSNRHSVDSGYSSKISSEFFIEEKLQTNIGSILSRKEKIADRESVHSWYVVKMLQELPKAIDVLIVKEEDEEESTATQATTIEEDVSLQYTTTINNQNEELTTSTESLRGTTLLEDPILTTSCDDKLAQETINAEQTTEDVALEINTNDKLTTSDIFTTPENSFTYKLPQATITVEFTTENRKSETNVDRDTTGKLFGETEGTTSQENLTESKKVDEAADVTLDGQLIKETCDRTTDLAETEDLTDKEVLTAAQTVTTEETKNLLVTTDSPEDEKTAAGSDHGVTTPCDFNTRSSEDTTESKLTDEDTIHLAVSLLPYLENISHQLLKAISAKEVSKIRQLLHDNPRPTCSESSRTKRSIPESSCSSENFTCPYEGNFRFNQSCTKYYECSFNSTCNKLIPTILKCPKCFKFNAQKSHCDLPENVPECTYPSLQKFYCTGQGQYFVPDDCHKYYDCRENGNGTIDLVVKECPSGTTFKAIEGRCVEQKCKLRTAKCTQGIIYSMDRFSCSSFHYCMRSNRTISMLCPTGFVFDGKLCQRWEESELKQRLSKLQKPSDPQIT